MRRKTQWVTTQSVAFVLIAGAQDALILFDINSLSIAPKGCTITRLLLDLEWSSNAVGQDNTMFWGITTVSQDARAAGSLPETDIMIERAGWLGRGRMRNKMLNLDDYSQRTVLRLDLRSQRVIRNDTEELLLIVDNAGSFSGIWTAFVRTLVKLPL